MTQKQRNAARFRSKRPKDIPHGRPGAQSCLHEPKQPKLPKNKGDRDDSEKPKRKFVKWKKGYGGPRPPDPEVHVPKNFYKKDSEDPRAHLNEVTALLLAKALDNGCRPTTYHQTTYRTEHSTNSYVEI